MTGGRDFVNPVATDYVMRQPKMHHLKLTIGKRLRATSLRMAYGLAGDSGRRFSYPIAIRNRLSTVITALA